MAYSQMLQCSGAPYNHKFFTLDKLDEGAHKLVNGVLFDVPLISHFFCEHKTRSDVDVVVIAKLRNSKYPTWKAIEDDVNSRLADIDLQPIKLKYL